MKPSTIFFVLIPLVLVGIIGFAIYKGNAPSKYDDFASCMTEKGAKMYGSWWCPFCEAQKKEFGTAFKNIDYVECSEPSPSRKQLEKCTKEGIESYPVWRFGDGSEAKGKQSFKTLAEKTGCELPE